MHFQFCPGFTGFDLFSSFANKFIFIEFNDEIIKFFILYTSEIFFFYLFLLLLLIYLIIFLISIFLLQYATSVFLICYHTQIKKLF